MFYLLQAIKAIDKTLGLDGMHVELASDERVHEMVEFLSQHFYPDEILCKSIGLVIEEGMKKLLVERYKGNMSLLLISDVTHEVIGARTITVESIQEHTTGVVSTIQHEMVRTIHTFLSHKNTEMDVFKRFGVDHAVHFLNIAIRHDYRKQGLASKLMKAALLFVKDIGLDPVCITGEGTSNYSQSIYDKLQFEMLHSVMYEDYKVNGDVVFKDTGVNKSCKFYAIQL